MASATITIPDEVKDRLKKFSWINWSEVAREEALKYAKKVELLRKFDSLTKNSELTDSEILKFVKESRTSRFNELKSKGLV